MKGQQAVQGDAARRVVNMRTVSWWGFTLYGCTICLQAPAGVIFECHLFCSSRHATVAGTVPAWAGGLAGQVVICCVAQLPASYRHGTRFAVHTWPAIKSLLLYSTTHLQCSGLVLARLAVSCIL